MPAIVHAGPSCPDGQVRHRHRVVQGETLSGVAHTYDTNVREIRRQNPGLDPNMIRPGQEIRVCTKKSKARKRSSKSKTCRQSKKVKHRVESGETLSRIAERYAVSERDILADNPALKNNPNKLRAGQTLTICADPRRQRGSRACGYRMPLYVHRVIPGEWASEIAGRYGVRRKDLYRLNPKLKANPNLIRPGQRIRVCPEIAPRERDRFTHRVRQGENLGSIAKKYGLTVRELESYQQGKLANRDTLRVGQELVVWRDGRLVAGFGGFDDDTGVLRSGMQLPPGRAYVIKRPSLAYGTNRTIRLIQQATRQYTRKKGGGPKVHIGDISKKGGGKLPPHRSHQHGHDVDVGYVLKGNVELGRRFHSASARNLDVKRTWILLKAFLDTDQIQYIFMDYRLQKLVYEHAKKTRAVSADTLDELFQYPRGRHRSHGIIRHWKGHVNHFHVRFRR
ncbi:MAG: LysM peptidoglycan-binding domain-containing protein [Myxococcales bacterium FL481]|nr:MAG: LysM peptidoglycan-binding domain-containing protein [Myxococcales bacterium FL481]